MRRVFWFWVCVSVGQPVIEISRLPARVVILVDFEEQFAEPTQSGNKQCAVLSTSMALLVVGFRFRVCLMMDDA